jgi:hypothetical protein
MDFPWQIGQKVKAVINPRGGNHGMTKKGVH